MFQAHDETIPPGRSSNRYSMDDEQTILDRVRAGDQRAFGQLVDLHKDGAFTLALRILASREEAEETVQDAFLRVHRRLASFRGDSRFATWLYRIVFNLSTTRVKRRRTPAESLDAHAEEAMDMVRDAEGGGVLEHLERQETVALLAKGLTRLPEPHRIAVELFYLQEQSYEETATIMGIPLGTVKTYLFRGRVRLKLLLAEMMNEEERAA
jgi:RNA polymerase sigma-70 factor (ECF subfamily)